MPGYQPSELHKSRTARLVSHEPDLPNLQPSLTILATAAVQPKTPVYGLRSKSRAAPKAATVIAGLLHHQHKIHGPRRKHRTLQPRAHGKPRVHTIRRKLGRPSLPPLRHTSPLLGAMNAIGDPRAGTAIIARPSSHRGPVCQLQRTLRAELCWLSTARIR